MKVIKKADVSGWSYKHTCVNCESELEVENKDLVHHHYSGDQREPSYDSFSASCMVCNETFSIPAPKIPKLIQLAAKSRSARTTSISYLDR